MTIYTYYEYLEPDPWGMSPLWWHQMLTLWENTWSDQGWAPKILGLRDAVKSSRFQKINQRVKSVPTVNPSNYELACWRRWCAFATVSPGWIVDFDVLNFGWPPRKAPRTLTTARPPRNWSGGTLGGPLSKVASWIERDPLTPKSERGRPHLSDMNLIDRHADELKWLGVERVVNEPDWEAAPLVHFAGAACVGLDRVQLMRDEIQRRSRLSP